MGPPPTQLRIQSPTQLSTVAPLRTRARTIIGASSIGAGHVRSGLPCQDAFRVVEEDGTFAIAVADGLGSARQSEIGATLAVHAAANRAMRSASDDPSIAALESVVAARKALERLAGLRRHRLSAFACTLLVAVGNSERIGVAHIGDGAVVASSGDEPCVLSPPAPSEYLNEVDPLTGDDWMENVRWMSARIGLDALALLTDGCQHAALRRINGSLQAHAGFFVPLFEYARSCVDAGEGSVAVEQLLSGRKMSEHSDDDKTLVLAVLPRRGEAEA